MTEPDAGTPLRFVIVGAANTLLGLGVIYFFKWFLDFGDIGANVCGYTAGLTTSFALNRNWTFRHRGAAAAAFGRFLTVFALAYLLNLGTVLALIRLAGANTYLAQAIGMAPYTVFFYLGSRHFAFRTGSIRGG